MGWFWSSTTPVTASSTSSPSSSSSSSQTPDAPATQPSAPPPSGSADVDGDPELRKFMAMFDVGANDIPSAPSQKTSPPPASASSAASTVPVDDTPSRPSRLSSWTSAWASSSSSPSSSSSSPSSTAATSTVASDAAPPFVPRERSLAEATLPVHMSCRQAFDLAWACQSPGGQWRAVYRHGGVRPCSALWDDFWFCMRVKGYAEGPAKEEAIRSHFRDKEIERYYLPGRPSSEDVWRSRTVDEVLPPGAVFQNHFQVDVGDDDARADARRVLAEEERRQQIRGEMGYKN